MTISFYNLRAHSKVLKASFGKLMGNSCHFISACMVLSGCRSSDRRVHQLGLAGRNSLDSWLLQYAKMAPHATDEAFAEGVASLWGINLALTFQCDWFRATCFFHEKTDRDNLLAGSQLGQSACLGYQVAFLTVGAVMFEMFIKYIEAGFLDMLGFCQV